MCFGNLEKYCRICADMTSKWEPTIPQHDIIIMFLHAGCAAPFDSEVVFVSIVNLLKDL